MLSRFAPAAILFAAATSVHAATNDWSKPCTSGECFYDVARSKNSMGASLRVWGRNEAISDITTAAGWHIIGCDSHKKDQDIRLVCSSHNTADAGCEHVHQGATVGTIVRLPENCGTSPFAVITANKPSDDQRIPDEIARKISPGARGEMPTVQSFTLSTDFDSVSAEKLGEVNFDIIGTTTRTQGLLDRVRDNNLSRRSRIDRRGVLENRGFLDAVKSTFDDLKATLESSKKANGNGAKMETNGFWGDIFDHLPHGDWDHGMDHTFAPFDLDKEFELVHVTSDCDNYGNLNFTIDAHPKVHAEVSIGLVLKGTMIPPAVTDFSVNTGINADLEGDIIFHAEISGSPLDTGEIQIPGAELGVPGLDIPGIFSIGPAFKLKARANVDLELDVELTVGMAFSIENLLFSFPPNGDTDTPSSGGPAPKDSPLALSASPNVTAKGTISAHIIPTIEFGISALGGAKAVIFTDVDTSANLVLTFDAGTTVSTTVGGQTDAPASSSLPDSPTTSTSVVDTSSSSAAETPSSTAVPSDTTTPSDTAAPSSTMECGAPPEDTSALSPVQTAQPHAEMASSRRSLLSKHDDPIDGFQGCVDINIGILAQVGASGNFFNLFKTDKTFPIFTKTFDLWKKCFGNVSEKKAREHKAFALSARSMPRSASSLVRLAGRDIQITCPIGKSKPPAPSTVTDGTVGAGDIHERG